MAAIVRLVFTLGFLSGCVSILLTFSGLYYMPLPATAKQFDCGSRFQDQRSGPGRDHRQWTMPFWWPPTSDAVADPSVGAGWNGATSGVPYSPFRGLWIRAFIADTFALPTFFTVCGSLSELPTAGMDWRQVVSARIVALPIMTISARLYGVWRDFMMPPRGANARGGLRATLVDAFALLSFQIPVYAAIVTRGGASGEEILRACLGAGVIMMFVGRPYEHVA